MMATFKFQLRGATLKKHSQSSSESAASSVKLWELAAVPRVCVLLSKRSVLTVWLISVPLALTEKLLKVLPMGIKTVWLHWVSPALRLRFMDGIFNKIGADLTSIVATNDVSIHHAPIIDHSLCFWSQHLQITWCGARGSEISPTTTTRLDGKKTSLGK